MFGRQTDQRRLDSPAQVLSLGETVHEALVCAGAGSPILSRLGDYYRSVRIHHEELAAFMAELRAVTGRADLPDEVRAAALDLIGLADVASEAGRPLDVVAD